MFLGTIVNTLAVMAGSLIGIFLKSRFPDRFKQIIFQGLGLCTLVVGITMTLQIKNILPIIFSVVLGGIIGEALKIEEAFDRFGDWIKSRMKSNNEKFTDGLVGSTLIFCVGTMTIMGTFNAAVKNDHTLLLTKSMLDGFASIALGATLGSGVFFSSLAVLVIQGCLTLLAFPAKPFFTQLMIDQITGCGGILVIGIGINLLEVRKIKTANLLPALVLIALFTVLLARLIH